jgi:hypothetical protein
MPRVAKTGSCLLAHAATALGDDENVESSNSYFLSVPTVMVTQNTIGSCVELPSARGRQTRAEETLFLWFLWSVVARWAKSTTQLIRVTVHILITLQRRSYKKLRHFCLLNARKYIELFGLLT